MWCHLLSLSTAEATVVERHYLIHNWSSLYPVPQVIVQWPQDPTERHIHLIEHLHHGRLFSFQPVSRTEWQALRAISRLLGTLQTRITY